MKNLLLILISITLLLSCNSAKRLSQKADILHEKYDDIAAHKCTMWYPYKDSVHEKIVYKPGKPVYKERKTIYANCDSAYRAALAEAARTGKPINVKQVTVPCPPTEYIVDTIEKEKVVYQEDARHVTDLQYQLTNKTKQADNFHDKLVWWKKTALISCSSLLLVVASLIVWIYLKAKSSLVK